ncbi:ribosomal protein P2 [Ascoidea rubescens DSM 1968]|uniref:Ribosomal protein 60S n=1 Tax=Ascoidea rubescens DSM 1968 TaxID=1344418 RepID=A0A1D2VIL8_9ASCO|nr:ribosomal protein 60S [Ascoidea rubescens DSM 1968]ODV61475.1 ribosomal protein 60S [Ascoidea rubescens DSM 1968]
MINIYSAAGNTNPTAKEIKKVLKSVNAEIDETKLDKFLDEVSGKTPEELIAEGNSKLSSVPGGSSGSAAGGATTTDSTDKAEEKEEEADESEEESDDDMGFGLFD